MIRIDIPDDIAQHLRLPPERAEMPPLRLQTGRPEALAPGNS
jgi:hypothetical protein